MNEEAEDINWLFPHEDISAAYNAFYMVDSIDTELVSKETKRKIKAIQRMSIDIVYYHIKSMHESTGGDDEED